MYIDEEVDALRKEVKALKRDRTEAQLVAWAEKQESRKLPPMSGLTRVQKRYFLEPWMTTLAVVNFVLGFISLLVAAGLWNFRPLWMGFVFLATGAGCLFAKFYYMDHNVRTEGELLR